MTSYQPSESAKTDYAIPKPTRLNLLVPLLLDPIPVTYLFQARIRVAADFISRETQSERMKRVRKLAEDKFRIDQERIRRANKDRNDLGYKDDISDDTIIMNDLGRNDNLGHDHLHQEMESNLARPHAQTSGDVRIPSRYQTTSTTSTSTYTTTTHTSTSTHSFTTDNRGTSSVHISDAELHRRLTKEMAEKAERHRQREIQKERQGKRDMEEARYKAARSAQEARERDLEEAARERKRREREWARQNGKECEDASKRRRRGSTPLYNAAHGSGSGPGSEDEDYWEIPNSGATGSEGGGNVRNPTSTRISPREREKKERERYSSRWNNLLSNSNQKDTNTDSDSDNIIETELSYTDIPWPIYGKSKLEKKSVSLFLSNLALLPIQGGIRSGKEGREAERKILREAIRNFHPDRFLSKVLPRVREGERDKVKEGMEICSRVLTDLIMENSKSR